MVSNIKHYGSCNSTQPSICHEGKLLSTITVTFPISFPLHYWPSDDFAIDLQMLLTLLQDSLFNDLRLFGKIFRICAHKQCTLYQNYIKSYQAPSKIRSASKSLLWIFLRKLTLKHERTAKWFQSSSNTRYA